MCDTRDDQTRERQYLDMLLSRRVDGLIVTGRRIEPRPSIGSTPGIPVVDAMTQSLDLLAAISDAPAHGVHAVPSRLVIRESTDRPPLTQTSHRQQAHSDRSGTDGR